VETLRWGPDVGNVPMAIMLPDYGWADCFRGCVGRYRSTKFHWTRFTPYNEHFVTRGRRSHLKSGAGLERIREQHLANFGPNGSFFNSLSDFLTIILLFSFPQDDPARVLVGFRQTIGGRISRRLE